MDDGSDELNRSTLHERVAARALDVDLNADPREVRRAFRREVKAIHPDSSVDDGCPDLGRLADARDVLFHRYARLVAAGLVEPIDPPMSADADRQLSGDDWLRRFEAQDARLVRERRLKEQVERMMREETAAYRSERARIRKLAEENKRRLERTLRSEPGPVVVEPTPVETPPVQPRTLSRREQLLREVQAAERERQAALRVLARQRAAAQRSSVARPKPMSHSTSAGDHRPRVAQPDDGIGVEVDLAG